MSLRERSKKLTRDMHESVYPSSISLWEYERCETLIWSSKYAGKPSGYFLFTERTYKAVSENLEVKQRIFGELAAETRPDTILATNTSSISITKIAVSAVPQGESAASTLGKSSAGRVVGQYYGPGLFSRSKYSWPGLHFFNPVPVMVSSNVRPARRSPSHFRCVETGRIDLGIANVGGYIITCSSLCGCM